MGKKQNHEVLTVNAVGFSVKEIRKAVDSLQELLTFQKHGTANLHCETVNAITEAVIENARNKILSNLADVQSFISETEDVE